MDIFWNYTMYYLIEICKPSEGFTNPLTPKSDRHLISLNSITPESNINVMRMKGMITNPRSS